VFNAAEPAGVQIPPVRAFRQLYFIHALF
jgi:hypothetical protein